MTINSDTTDPREERTSRRGRGLGPFSGGQLTIIITVIAAVFLFPVSAWAAFTVSHVTVTDNAGVNTAVVDSSGSLQTKVAGTVVAVPAAPSAGYNVTNNAFQSSPNSCTNVTPSVPAGKALVVTSISVAINGATTGPVDTWVEAGTTASACSVTAGKFIAYAITPGTIGTLNLPMPSGVGFKAGHTVSIGIHAASGNGQADVTVHGYLVPSSHCQAAAGGPVGCY